ncbi:hypothetical protein [Cellulomonas sp. URHB0016]
MSAETDVRRPRVDGLGLLLPESWWTVDLTSEASRRRSVAKLVEHQVGRDDQRANLRADLRKELGRAVDESADRGGLMMAISLMRAGDVPVPATLTVYRVPGAGLLGVGLDELELILRAGSGTFDSLDLAEGPRGPVLRRVGRRDGPEDLGAEKVEMLVAEYWLSAGDELDDLDLGDDLDDLVGGHELGSPGNQNLPGDNGEPGNGEPADDEPGNDELGHGELGNGGLGNDGESGARHPAGDADGPGLVSLVFSTPLVVAREPMLLLFDTIVATLGAAES